MTAPTSTSTADCTTIRSRWVIAVTFVVDLAYAAVDPRLRGA